MRRDASSVPITGPRTPRSEVHWRWWFAAATATAGCGACLALWRRDERNSSAARPRTDFDGFLKAQPAAATAPAVSQPAQRGAAQRSATSFGSFLKDGSSAQPSHQRDPTSFGSFLKGSAPHKDAQHDNSDGSTDAQSGAASHNGGSGAESQPSPDSVPVTVLFGTEFGFSKEIAEKLRDRLLAGVRYWPRLVDMADVPAGLDLSGVQTILCICSTQGDGVPPAEAREFCDWLQSEAPAKMDGVCFSVLALGDRSYTHFCRCGVQLDTRFEALGGRRLVDRHDVNREDWKTIDAWLAAVLAALPDQPLRTAAELGGTQALPAGKDAVSTKRWSKARPYPGTVVAMEGLCAVRAAGDKDTVRVEIELGDSGLRYEPGDALGIYPRNCPEAVDELLAVIDARGDEPVPVPSWQHGAGDAARDGAMPLRDALVQCYDIRSPKPELLRTLLAALTAADSSETARHGNSLGTKVMANGHANGYVNGWMKQAAAPKLSKQQQVERLQAVLDGDVEAYFEPRHVIDVLTEFRHAKPPLPKLLAALRPLQPRLYSISSSQLEHPTRVQVTVAVVRYESLQRQRIGVTSTYLAERLAVGTTVPVYVSKNPDFRLPADPATPIIMVGPGTGLAPFRAFMQERLLGPAHARAKVLGTLADGAMLHSDGHVSEQGSSGVADGREQGLGEAVLYFGCRRRDQDFLYGEQLEGWAAGGHLTLFTAFSREQVGKVYVQDRLRETGDLVWRLLQAGGHFYVCGDAAQMAGAVEAALLDIITTHQGGTAEEAQAYLNRLSDSLRYQRDVWY